MIKLPLAESPSIGYLDYAYSFSIMLTNERTFPWFYSNFIQLYFYSEDKLDPLRFLYFDYRGYQSHWHAYLPFLDYKIIPREMFTRDQLDLNAFIKNWIFTDQHYIITTIDEFFIPGKNAYRKYNFPHAMMIYGYDDDGYFIAGFNEKVQYTYQHVSWNNFKKAFYSPKACDVSSSTRDIQLIQHYKRQYDYPLDLVHIKNQLTDYIYAKKTTEHYRQFIEQRSEHRFGLEVYGGLIKYYSSISSNENVNVRPLHLLWEHKKIMSARIRFLGKNNCLYDYERLLRKYKVIEDKAQICRNMFVKYMITNQINCIEKINSILDELCGIEKNVLQEVVENIKQ